MGEQNSYLVAVIEKFCFGETSFVQLLDVLGLASFFSVQSQVDTGHDHERC